MKRILRLQCSPGPWARGFAFLVLSLSSVFAGATAGPTNSPIAHALLLDSLGRIVEVPTNQIHHSLLPSSDQAIKRQTPEPLPGMSMPPQVQRRLQDARAGAEELQFFPEVSPHLMPYLAGFDEHGNTALRPGALFNFVPLDAFVQKGKYWLGDQGLRYSLQQGFTVVGMSDVLKGSSTLSFYTLDLKAKWAILDAPTAGTAGWVTTQIAAKTGLGDAGETQSPKSNLGTLTEANYDWSNVNGFRVPELAWQQSLMDGELVVVAGKVSQRNYIDGNAEAHTARGQFMNSALVHSQVLPLPEYNFGLNLQWQPKSEWYAMLGGTVGNASAGQSPWTDFSWNSWSLISECGYASGNFMGLGPGVYRIQPFVAEKGGPTQAGLCFDLQQHLGPQSPFAWFGRFGFGGSVVTDGASAQAGTGFVMQAPLRYLGLVPKLSNDLAGVGLVWSQPSATTKTVYHENEYILEAFYTLQLTPTITLQPDLQGVWNPVFNRDAGPALVAQLQLNLAW